MELVDLIDEMREKTRGFTLGGEFRIEKESILFDLKEHSTGVALELMIGVIRENKFSWHISMNKMVIFR